MSQENTETVSTGRLLCAIGNTGAHLWVMRGFDVFLYEQGVAAVRVTAKETFSAHREHGSTFGARPGLGSADRIPIEELLAWNPANRFVALSELAEARLARGMFFRSLVLIRSDGTKDRWVWGGPPSREKVRWALDRMGL